MASGVEVAALLSVLFSALLYGGFVVLSAVSIYLLIKARENNPSYPVEKLASTAALMLVLATIHIGTQVRIVLTAFVNSSSTEASITRLTAFGTSLYIVKGVAYVLQILVGDGFWIYRLSRVWSGYSWHNAAVLPFAVCFLASIGVAIGCIIEYSQPPGSWNALRAERWTIAFLSLTLFQNLCCSTLIAARVWYIQRQGEDPPQAHRLKRVVVMVVDSGFIYCAFLVAFIALAAKQSPGQIALADTVVQVIGFVFSLIMLRVALGVREAEAPVDCETSATPPTRSQLTSRINSSTATTLGRQADAVSTTPRRSRRGVSAPSPPPHVSVNMPDRPADNIFMNRIMD